MRYGALHQVAWVLPEKNFLFPSTKEAGVPGIGFAPGAHGHAEGEGPASPHLRRAPWGAQRKGFLGAARMVALLTPAVRPRDRGSQQGALTSTNFLATASMNLIGKSMGGYGVRVVSKTPVFDS